MSLFRAHGSRIIAEDLGVVPDFVRESQTREQIPGLKVLRWEREWEEDGRPFRDPRGYRAVFRGDQRHARHRVDGRVVGRGRRGRTPRDNRRSSPAPASELSPSESFSDRVRDALLAALFHAGSDFALVALPDIFGWRDRINTPSSVNDENWTWRLPWPVEALSTGTEGTTRASFLRHLATASRRTLNLEP